MHNKILHTNVNLFHFHRFRFEHRAIRMKTTKIEAKTCQNVEFPENGNERAMKRKERASVQKLVYTKLTASLVSKMK